MGFCTFVGDDYQPCRIRSGCHHPSYAENVLQCTHSVPCRPGGGIINRRCAVTSYTTCEYPNEQNKRNEETSLVAHDLFPHILT